MENSVIGTLSSALDFGSARLQAVSNNLSNINTAGYKRKDVSFDALLNAASNDSEGTPPPLPVLLTDPRHMAIDDTQSQLVPSITTQAGGAMRMDGNNVDVESESTRLAASEIYYGGVAQLLQGQFSGLKYAISGGK